MSPPADPVPQPGAEDSAAQASATEEERITARLLDAALAEFSAYGLRRTSMETVAERAGLARSTLYRRFSNKRDLARAVALRQSRVHLVELVRAVEGLPTDWTTSASPTRRSPLVVTTRRWAPTSVP